MDTATTPLTQAPNPFASVQPSVSSTPPSVTPSKRPTVQAPPIPQTRRLSDGISDLSSGSLFRNTNFICSVESYEMLVRFSSRLEMKLTSGLNNYDHYDFRPTLIIRCKAKPHDIRIDGENHSTSWLPDSSQHDRILDARTTARSAQSENDPSSRTTEYRLVWIFRSNIHKQFKN